MIDRRQFLNAGSALIAVSLSATIQSGCRPADMADDLEVKRDKTNEETQSRNGVSQGKTMKVQYIEIVTPDVDAICAIYSRIHGVAFSEPDRNVGGARTAGLGNDVTLGVRSPMHAGENPVVRPYIVVDDIEAAVRHAEQAGAQTIVPPMPIPGKGMCAIVYQGGIELGLWQL